MAVYSYKAIAADGPLQRGTITADTPRAARDLLRARGLRVRDLAEARVSRGSLSLARLFTDDAKPRASRRHEGKVVAFCRELSTLLAAGIPLLPSLDALVRQQKGAFAADLMLLRDRVAAGESLAAAMRSQPALFDPLAVSMVEVGERSGTLDDVLGQLAAFKHRSHQFRGRLANALVYPIIVVATGIGVTLFLMTFVVPQLLDALLEAGATLPLMTRIVKTASDLLLAWWWLLLLVAAVAGALGLWARRMPTMQRRAHALVLRLPLFGDLVRKQAIVRIAIAMAALTRSGIDFVQAMSIIRGSIGNRVIADALARAENEIAAGRDIGPALGDTGVFPATVVQVVDVGQATGKLDAMLERLAADYDQEVVAASQRMIALLEPALILLLATFIGFIVLSVILPYMEIGNVL